MAAVLQEYGRLLQSAVSSGNKLVALPARLKQGPRL